VAEPTVPSVDPRLDRRVSFDERSKQFPIRTMLGPPAQPRPLRSYSWKRGDSTVLDQGQEGACVGFGWTHELIARPKPYTGLTDDFAQRVYLEAQTLDEWPGEAYSGTSVLAGAKVLQARRFMAEYRWAFGLSDVLETLGYLGPVVCGLNWYSGMMTADARGYIRPTGVIEGGHCVAVTHVSITEKRVGGPNSWGRDWGYNGQWFMTWDDFERLLHEQGEACVPVNRLAQPAIA